MDFRFTEEQHRLIDLAGRVAARISMPDDPDDMADLTPLHETGLGAMLVPEAAGGGGATLIEGTILAEQLGRHLAPAHAVSSALLAPAALELVVSDEVRTALTARLVDGESGCVAVAGDLSWPPRDVAFGWGWAEGSFVLVPGAGGLVAWDGETPSRRRTEDPGLTVAPLAGPVEVVDMTRESAQWFLATANVVTAGLLVGHMAAALDLAVAYAKEREQFGVKIGSFQAIKHLCADMFVDLESSRSAAYGAAAIVATATGVAEAARAAAVAKAWCAEAAIRVVESSIQVHGGIGFTWECSVHRYLRAAHVMRASFMATDRALDLVGELAYGPA
jgi:alkylation response protein AidB-like acyl-CoA dehydrogenase